MNLKDHSTSINDNFILQLEKHALTSLKNSADGSGTEFIRPGSHFGGIFAAYKKAGSEWIAISNLPEALQEEKQLSQTYAGDVKTVATIPQNDLEIDTGFSTENNSLVYSIQLSNQTGTPLEIGDLAIPFPMNSVFAWGENAGEKVMRHGIIAGHGSYLFWSRCDGTGPILVMTPIGNTSLEYFDLYKGTEGESQQLYRAYIHSRAKSEAVEGQADRWRQKNTSVDLAPEASISYSFRFRWASDYAAVKKVLVDEGLVDVEVLPGMTLPHHTAATLSLQTNEEIFGMDAEHPDRTELQLISQEGGRSLYRLRFGKLGENKLTVRYGEGKHLILEFFVTEEIQTLIRKRAAFIASHQHRDKTLWYDGLFAEWNMETQTLLGPDNYDRIKGWRIYEVTCDDPGLSKPAFLAAKNAEYPVQEEICALDYYIENFVWGRLQRTDEEEYSYGIYGIPDWKTNRLSQNKGPRGNLHIWRIYDYPHILLLYWSMYRITRDYSCIKTSLPKEQYLERTYRTALAMFTIPVETGDWTAYQTGLYNELIIVDIIRELAALGMEEKAFRLSRHWERKVRFFVKESTDLFGSEYPFDSTGFESTHAFAVYALHQASYTSEGGEDPKELISGDEAQRFMEQQMRSNIACRGWLEPAYYLLGSDYRVNSTAEYTLSYMSQMGGWAILDYALYHAPNPFPYLHLGYASYLSAWALMNTGNEESNYGYWYPGQENDGGAGGGFEPSPRGVTWLEQEHRRGSWYYSCETDLGYCGALRAARTILAKDPEYGWFCWGGEFNLQQDRIEILMRDGLNKRLHVHSDGSWLHMTLERARISSARPVTLTADRSEIELVLEAPAPDGLTAVLSLEGLPEGSYEVWVDSFRLPDEKVATSGGKLDLSIPVRQPSSVVRLLRHPDASMKL